MQQTTERSTEMCLANCAMTKNVLEKYMASIVEFMGENKHHVHYLRRPFQREPDFGVTSVNYDFTELIARSGVPC